MDEHGWAANNHASGHSETEEEDEEIRMQSLLDVMEEESDDDEEDTKKAPTKATRTGRALKRIMGNSIFYAHHLKLEASMLLNFRAIPQSSDPPTWELESLQWPLRGAHLIFTSCMLALNTVPEEAQCTYSLALVT